MGQCVFLYCGAPYFKVFTGPEPLLTRLSVSSKGQGLLCFLKYLYVSCMYDVYTFLSYSPAESVRVCGV